MLQAFDKQYLERIAWTWLITPVFTSLDLLRSQFLGSDRIFHSGIFRLT
ncbi:hypothetical protein COO91_07348 [Nostoc flagelliforme CCNUN1]|uniref:Uncharacterized protein n=1 Tax=Nostoc flagelliforme CCNUN1 TaxID=2038116 RepID=A0A2K8T0Z1_9NOSO|nr:hypothetical protein COO91_07348 [Nostoc flagelliforme CCNUN1]